MTNKQQEQVAWATGNRPLGYDLDEAVLEEADTLKSMYTDWVKQTKAIQKELKRQGAMQAAKQFERAYMETSKVMV